VARHLDQKQRPSRFGDINMVCHSEPFRHLRWPTEHDLQ
jgi:hypothetical protein